MFIWLVPFKMIFSGTQIFSKYLMMMYFHEYPKMQHAHPICQATLLYKWIYLLINVGRFKDNIESVTTQVVRGYGKKS